MQKAKLDSHLTHIDWPLEQSLALDEAVLEAMETPAILPPPASSAPPLSTTHVPPPHVPLRRASAHKLHQQQKRSTPTPLWASPTQTQLRGFNPSPVQAMPQIDGITATSEHAFAGKEERKNSFRPPLGVLESLEQDVGRRESDQMDGASLSRPPSSPLLLSPPPTPKQSSRKNLKTSKSLGDGLRGWRNRFSAPDKRAATPADRDTTYSVPVMRPRMMTPTDEVRDSFRSALTSSSSYVNTNSVHSSMTGDSSHSEYVQEVTEPDGKDSQYGNGYGEDEEGMMSVDDVLGMYEEGFSSAKPSTDTARTSRPTSQPSAFPSPERKQRPYLSHRRSQSASLLIHAQQYTERNGALAPPRPSTSHHNRTFSKILNGPENSHVIRPTSGIMTGVPRDRYGFKKASQHITIEAYDAWNATYTEHVTRRSKKWHVMMKSYGLSTDKPYRFPPKSDKAKRYVRKGVPPEFRGAAWFWYAGGPGKMAKEPGLYFDVLERVKNGELSDNDREHIERDLNRTFPDNVRFKPDPTKTLDAQAGASGGQKRRSRNYNQRDEPETPIVQALRRVLQTFAVHNPAIGYCQSLNFIAGLLLLFLNEDEEKTFVLLNIVTTTHLPGTHGVALEGANVDIAVLMNCIKESLPAIWAKLDDKGTSALVGATSQTLRLPTVSLATTAWFMSLFVGTLPIEAVLRVWDCLFFEGSKTLFRIALAIFKALEPKIGAVSDPMEVFQVVQTSPRSMLDINALMEVCFRRRGGFGHVSQESIEKGRAERRKVVREGVAGFDEGRRGWRSWRMRSRTGVE